MFSQRFPAWLWPAARPPRAPSSAAPPTSIWTDAPGAVVGAATTNSLGGAIVGAGIGAIAGAILVESANGWCTYRYKGKLYRERCR